MQQRTTHQLQIAIRNNSDVTSEVISTSHYDGDSEAEPMVRRRDAISDQKDLNFGWIEDPGAVIIQNNEGVKGRALTLEEVRQLAPVVVVVRDKQTGTVITRVPPDGRFAVLYPDRGRKYTIECLQGIASVFMFVTPRGETAGTACRPR